jgi:hypothetical protein
MKICPGHNVRFLYEVFVERLMHVPKKRDKDSGHKWQNTILDVEYRMPDIKKALA